MTISLILSLNCLTIIDIVRRNCILNERLTHLACSISILDSAMSCKMVPCSTSGLPKATLLLTWSRNRKRSYEQHYNKKSLNLVWRLSKVKFQLSVVSGKGSVKVKFPFRVKAGTTTYPVNHELQGSLGLTYQPHAMMNTTWTQATLKMQWDQAFFDYTTSLKLSFCIWTW